MNSFQFNIYLSIATLLGQFFLPLESLLNLPKWIVLPALLCLYIGEFWAFLFKLKLVRIKNLFELSNGDPKKKVGEIGDPGCMMFYAFLMRFVFRFSIFLFAFMILFGEPEGELSGWAITVMIIIVLFELFNMMYSIYETHIFRLKTDDDDEKDLNEYWEKELKWRAKNFPLIQNANNQIKLKFADFILFLSGCAVTALFWDGCNREFVSFIKRSALEGESPVFVILLVVIACSILCLFFLMPVKLAFWIERLINSQTPQEIKRYRWSIFFAGISVSAPSLIQLVKTYLLQI